MSRMMAIPSHIDMILGQTDWSAASLSLFRLASSISPLLLYLVRRVGLFVILAATEAGKKQRLLRVTRAQGSYA
jgi:hypothetical protein